VFQSQFSPIHLVTFKFFFFLRFLTTRWRGIVTLPNRPALRFPSPTAEMPTFFTKPRLHSRHFPPIGPRPSYSTIFPTVSSVGEQDSTPPFFHCRQSLITPMSMICQTPPFFFPPQPPQSSGLYFLKDQISRYRLPFSKILNFMENVRTRPQGI